MITVSIDEATARLPELIDSLRADGEVIITKDYQPVAKLSSAAALARRPRQPGSARGKLVILAEDDGYLEDFANQMG